MSSLYTWAPLYVYNFPGMGENLSRTRGMQPVMTNSRLLQFRYRSSQNFKFTAHISTLMFFLFNSTLEEAKAIPYEWAVVTTLVPSSTWSVSHICSRGGGSVQKVCLDSQGLWKKSPFLHLQPAGSPRGKDELLPRPLSHHPSPVIVSELPV